jgi:hypothetical protein
MSLVPEDRAAGHEPDATTAVRWRGRATVGGLGQAQQLSGLQPLSPRQLSRPSRTATAALELSCRARRALALARCGIAIRMTIERPIPTGLVAGCSPVARVMAASR